MPSIDSGSRVALLVAGLVLALGCEEPDDFSYYFEARTYGDPSCDMTNLRLDGRRRIRLFTHRQVEVTDASRALARYYRRFGFTFFTDASAAVTEMSYALDTRTADLEAAIEKEFPGVDLTDEAALMSDPELYRRVLKVAANFMMRPMVEFARAHGTGGGEYTNLVVLPDIARPGGGALGPPGASPAGLAVSPALIAALVAENPADGQVWQDVDFPTGFTPMLFLHGTLLGQLVAVDPHVRDLVVAHEFGHTAGLVHRQVDGNLMTPFAILGTSKCSDTLDPDQLATFRRNVGLDSVRQSLRQTADEGPLARPLAPLGPLLRGERQALARFFAPLL